MASSSSSSMNLKIVNVWDDSFQIHFDNFISTIRNYNVIVVDTEFAGILEKIRYKKKDDVYAQMKRNINETKCIQVGFDDSMPRYRKRIPCIWNFNLQFDMETDTYCPDAMELLQTNEMVLRKHARDGISAHKLCEAMLNSELLLTSALSVYPKTWLTYGWNYNLGHCVKFFQPTNVLPNSRLVFEDMARSYFGERFFGVKLMSAYIDLAYGKMKLATVVARFNVDNGGVSHKPVADALITLKLYQILKIKDGNVNCVNMVTDLFYGATYS
ncbi:hypothetical protein DCAR_0101074 [Daucus carota subsp. sativus]|uniref:Uncharacterized protein n=1 Tax=Daucus carota subsp. sativus TaxID=79200 RepID=A0A166G4A3_DAUCS|nr:PREDICTED: probable CCR4-associated factor 1 homolog 6 [Daucus carota subsp. sativus]WOG81918.1 hypothetical protein DCAR_0101074 [Daucus carota subsp. sativus]